MGFIKDLSEVVRQQEIQETQQDVDLVVAFFRYIESLADDDVVDIYLPKEVYVIYFIFSKNTGSSRSKGAIGRLT